MIQKKADCDRRCFEHLSLEQAKPSLVEFKVYTFWQACFKGTKYTTKVQTYIYVKVTVSDINKSHLTQASMVTPTQFLFSQIPKMKSVLPFISSPASQKEVRMKKDSSQLIDCCWNTLLLLILQKKKMNMWMCFYSSL